MTNAPALTFLLIIVVNVSLTKNAVYNSTWYNDPKEKTKKSTEDYWQVYLENSTVVSTQNNTEDFNQSVYFTVYDVFNKTKEASPTKHFGKTKFSQRSGTKPVSHTVKWTVTDVFGVTKKVLSTQNFSDEIDTIDLNNTASWSAYHTFNVTEQVLSTRNFSNDLNNTPSWTFYDTVSVTEQMLSTQNFSNETDSKDFDNTRNWSLYDTFNVTEEVIETQDFNNTANWTVYETFNVTDEVLPTKDLNISSLTEFNQKIDSYYVQKNKEYQEEVPIPTILESCFEYLNVSNKDNGFINATASWPSVVLTNEDGEQCLKIKMDVLIQVNLLRNKETYKIWSAAFFTTLPDVNLTVTGVCDENNKAFVQILWDEYVLTWRFVKKPDQNSWYLRSLEFLTSKSDWFESYGFIGSRCWRFQYFSSGMFESPLDESFKACSQTVLKLSSEESSLNVYLFLLKNNFEVEAFIRNETFYNRTVPMC